MHTNKCQCPNESSPNLRHPIKLYLYHKSTIYRCIMHKLPLWMDCNLIKSWLRKGPGHIVICISLLKICQCPSPSAGPRRVVYDTSWAKPCYIRPCNLMGWLQSIIYCCYAYFTVHVKFIQAYSKIKLDKNEKETTSEGTCSPVFRCWVIGYEPEPRIDMEILTWA